MMSGRGRDTNEEEEESITYDGLEFASSDNDSLFEKDEEVASSRSLLTTGRRTTGRRRREGDELKKAPPTQPPSQQQIQPPPHDNNNDDPDATKVKLTKDLALKGISKVSMTKKERERKGDHLGRVVSLHLQRKGIEALVPDELEGFYCLAHLYLYNNKISKITGLECLPQLESLHLNGNRISRVENLDGCPNLKRLYLGQNEIEVVEGLENLFGLVELHLEHQRLPPEQPMLFCPNSLDIISKRLKVLNVSGNQLENLEDLICMSGLDTLNAAKNNMTDLDQVAFVLRSLRFLRVLDLRDNPLVKNPKYKEKTIGYMNRLEVLDGKDVSESTKASLQRFCSAKAMRKKAAAVNRFASHQTMSGTPSRLFSLSPQNSSSYPSYPLGLMYSNQSLHQPKATAFPSHTSPSPSFPDRNKYFNFSTPISRSPVPPVDNSQMAHHHHHQITTQEIRQVGPQGGIVFSKIEATTNPNISGTPGESNFYASRTTAIHLEETNPDKMSEMAKIIFRLSNLSPTTDEPDQSPEGFIRNRDNSYWNNASSASTVNNIVSGGVKEARPLSPLEEITDGQDQSLISGPADTPASSGKPLGSRRSAPIRRPMARKLPPRNSYGAGRTLSPLEELPTPRTGPDSFEGGEMRRPDGSSSPFPFQPSLPPWSEISKKKPISTSKATHNR